MNVLRLKRVLALFLSVAFVSIAVISLLEVLFEDDLDDIMPYISIITWAIGIVSIRWLIRLLRNH